jgi:hypothetical protein
MRTRRAFLIAILGLPLLGGAAMLWGNLASILGLRRRTGRALTAIVDLMFPGDAAPSAVSLGIADAIKEMSDLQTLIPNGVAWLDDWAVRQGALDFLSLDEIGKQHAVEAALASDDDLASQFIRLIRLRAGLIYYSEPAIKAAFPYTGPPQPNGFGDFAGPPQ